MDVSPFRQRGRHATDRVACARRRTIDICALHPGKNGVPSTQKPNVCKPECNRYFSGFVQIRKFPQRRVKPGKLLSPTTGGAYDSGTR